MSKWLEFPERESYSDAHTCGSAAVGGGGGGGARGGGGGGGGGGGTGILRLQIPAERNTIPMSCTPSSLAFMQVSSCSCKNDLLPLFLKRKCFILTREI